MEQTRTLSQRLYLMSKKIHYWVSWFIVFPLGMMIGSGVLLQNRDWIPGIQPASLTGSAPGQTPKLGPGEILQAMQQDSQFSALTWKEIQQLVFKPSKGTYTARLKGDREVQIDAQDGKILSVAVRYTGLLTDLHEGDWFSPHVKNFIFKPAGLVLVGLWFSGLVLMVFPQWKKWTKKT